MTQSHLRGSGWLDSPTHTLWRHTQGQHLLDFAKAARLRDGFGNLDRQGRLPVDAVADTVNTARMVHSYALAHLQGIPGSAPLVDHGVAALLGPLQDARHGGWFGNAAGSAGDPRKPAYRHAFVALAASSAAIAGRPGASTLLAQAVDILERHFWSEEEGALLESYALDWSDLESYRGGNSNMHGVEAALALADALDDPRWLDRALRISERVIHQHASAHHYLPVEHFDAHWQPVPDYNIEQPEDPYRPYGQTPGHAFEWARLLLQLDAARDLAGLHSPDWLVEDARQLFAAAVRLGWQVDGAEGIVYTVDWQHRPVVRERLHWTLAEAAAAAGALLRLTGEDIYEHWYRTFWDYIDLYLIDRVDGSWRHELDQHNQPASRIWPGKPDLYHAYQATLLPGLPLAPGLAKALRGREGA